jgi:hypothetical protein
MTTFNYPINRPHVFIYGTPGSGYCPHLSLLYSPTPSSFTSVLHLCVRDSIAIGYLLPIFDVSKLKNDPNNATQMIQSASPSRRRLTPNLHLKPPTHPYLLYHCWRSRESNLRWHSWSTTAPTSQQHVHYRSKLQAKQRRLFWSRTPKTWKTLLGF